MALENAFYIIGIIYMSISLLLIISVVVALLVIRKKVVSIEKMVKQKIDDITSIPKKAGKLVEALKSFTQDSN